MEQQELSPNLRWTGVFDRELRVFDIVMETEFGTTYNSYLLKAGDKTVLFETAKAKFDQEYLDTLDLGERKIDYVVLNHTEPDHVGCLAHMLELYPEAVVVATPVALTYLKNILNCEFTSLAAKKDMELVVGDKTLRFYPVPNLHWPDTMYTYIVEEKALITCDSFGAHYATEGILRSEIQHEEDYHKALKYYFDMILAPFKQPFMAKGLEVVKSLDVKLIGTGHGPVLDSNLPEILDLYEEWCRVPVKETKKILVPYVSAYGYTAQLAEVIIQELEQDPKLEVVAYDLVTADLERVVADLMEADGFLFGTPTILQTALKPVLDLLNYMTVVTHKGKVASAFGSCGWSGEGVPMVTQRLEQLKLKVMAGYSVRFKPSDEELQGARDFAREFATKCQ